MWFELNLIKKGLVSIDQMLSAVKRQQLSRVPIGRVAIEQGKMTMSQVFQVLQEQAENPKSFGRLAIDMDFLSEEELSHLLRMQGNLEQPLGEILIEMGCLSREQLEAESQLFQRQMTLRFETYDRQENPCSAKTNRIRGHGRDKDATVPYPEVRRLPLARASKQRMATPRRPSVDGSGVS